MQIKILAEGGSIKPGPALSQKLGPSGVNINQVIQKVNEATKNFSGMKVPVELDIDVRTKEINVKVFSPPVAELLKKEIDVEKGSGEQKRINVGNLSIEQVISIAKTKFPNLLCRNLKSAVKTIIGSCASLGILIENKNPVEIEKEIDEGKYDKEILEEKIEISEEKKMELEKYFSEIKIEQEKSAKQRQEIKEAEKKPEEEKK